MPFGSVTLTPGVNVERTPTLLRASFSQSNLIRFKDSLVQKYGGWDLFYQFAVIGVPRDLHAWQDLNNIDHLSIGTTQKLNVLTNGILIDITPQTLVSDFEPNISTTSGSSIVDIIDPNISNVTIYDSVFFNVPVSVGGLILDGLYQITEAPGSFGASSYQIDAGKLATTTETNPLTTSGTTTAGSNILNITGPPGWVVPGMVVSDITTNGVIPSSSVVTATGSNTVTINNNVIAPGVGSGDSIVISSVPVFTLVNGSSTVTVTFINHGRSPGDTVVFSIPTTFDGITISGSYKVVQVVDGDNYTINANTLATGSGVIAMNGGEAELVYYITLGPTPVSFGYGTGGYGDGGYGTGAGGSGQQPGTEIMAIDWTQDNFGQILMACPQNGGIYYWDPSGGFLNASLISTAPPFNSGIFVSMSQQIVIAYGSSIEQGIGYQQQPLLVQWCDVSNFFQWTASAATQAGNFTLSPGSKIVCGIAGSNQNLLWTDLDLWAMSYIGPPLVYGFNKIGAGCGAVSSHAQQQLRGSVYWMGRTNFYSYTGAGVSVIPCPVWDAVFQNLNLNFLQNIRAMPNTPFNEAGWLYPSAASTSGECDSYVKMNITEPGAPWDLGPLPRSAWTDQTVLGMPIGASPQGFIYQHETTNNADNVALSSSFTTGFFYLSEGEEFTFVDQVIPDFKFTTFTGGPSAQIQITFNVVNYPGDTPISYGPYTVTSATEYITVRFRGRFMSVTVQSSDLNSFWRVGSIKWRYSPAGRR